MPALKADPDKNQIHEMELFASVLKVNESHMDQ